MTQLSLWDDPVHPSSTAAACQAGGQAVVTTPKAPNKSAVRCRSSADALQRHIDQKHKSANNMFVLPPTRKRLRDATSLRNEAIRLERIQSALRLLADMHESGTIRPELANLTTKNALEGALFASPAGSPIHVLYNSVVRDERREERVLQLVNEAAMRGIPGYFPTPELLADQLVSMSHIQPGNRILEPSAGTGNLIDAILRVQQHVSVSYCELNCFLLEILRDKYAAVENIRFAGRDFCDIDCNRVGRFDRVIMNPPFENGEDAQHIMHAWCALVGAGGILTAIVSAGIFSRRNKKAEDFRTFLRDVGATVHDLPPGLFKTSGTEVSTKIVQIGASNLAG